MEFCAIVSQRTFERICGQYLQAFLTYLSKNYRVNDKDNESLKEKLLNRLLTEGISITTEEV